MSGELTFSNKKAADHLPNLAWTGFQFRPQSPLPSVALGFAFRENTIPSQGEVLLTGTSGMHRREATSEIDVCVDCKNSFSNKRRYFQV